MWRSGCLDNRLGCMKRCWVPLTVLTIRANDCPSLTTGRTKQDCFPSMHTLWVDGQQQVKVIENIGITGLREPGLADYFSPFIVHLQWQHICFCAGECYRLCYAQGHHLPVRELSAGGEDLISYPQYYNVPFSRCWNFAQPKSRSFFPCRTVQLFCHMSWGPSSQKSTGTFGRSAHVPWHASCAIYISLLL